MYHVSCLVSRPHFSSRPKRFGSRGPCKNVRAFPARSPRIRHGNELTERDWENAVQGLGNHVSTLHVSLDSWIQSVAGLPNPLSWIPDPKPRIPDSTSKNFSDSLTLGDLVLHLSFLKFTNFMIDNGVDESRWRITKQLLLILKTLYFQRVFVWGP